MVVICWNRGINTQANTDQASSSQTAEVLRTLEINSLIKQIKKTNMKFFAFALVAFMVSFILSLI